MDKPKILVIDIETKPATAYTWGLFDVCIGIEQVLEPGGIICFAAKWLGEREMEFYSEWGDGHEAMLRQAHRLLSEADAVVTYNGDKFDIRKLRGEFAQYNLRDVPPVTSIDVYKTVKGLGLLSNKLAFVGPFLQIGSKIKHAGFELWKKVIDGDPVAQVKMERYCKGDVRLLEKVYKRLRPFIRNHPHMGEQGAKACGACGSHSVQSRGYRRTRAMKIQRLHCQSCGAWFDGSRHKVP